MGVSRNEIATLAGVSLSTAAMILSGRGQAYSVDTREKVLEIAKRLNYRPSIHARGLRMKRSFLVGVSLFGGNTGLMADFLRGVQSGLEEEDYSPIVFSHSSSSEELECVRRCQARKVDGLIVNPAQRTENIGIDAKAYLDLAAAGLPMVEVFGRSLPQLRSVNVDDTVTARLAVEHLLALGHRRIAMLTHDRYDVGKDIQYGPHFDAWLRYCGYRDALQQVGGQPLVITHGITRELADLSEWVEGGARALPLIMAHPAKPTAVVCYNDFQAYGLIRAARQLKVELPGQLSIVGAVDSPMANIIQPTLTTLRIPAFDVGRQAVAMLLKLIDKQDCQHELLESRLIVRDSTSSPGEAASTQHA